MSSVKSISPLGFPWKTQDPFLFCAHHDDSYPAGNAELGPASSLEGRDIGQDFGRKDGWSMYHGETVPGFPQHPHRGFETLTLVRQGLIDHSDSLGATARFGGGDCQWLTAGKGIVHCEMFPLVSSEKPNPLELFQIWLNLPKVNKMVEPHFSMLWNEAIPRFEAPGVEVAIVAGQIADTRAPPPPPKSWASHANADVAIWTIKLAANAEWTLPAGAAALGRHLYFFRGNNLRVDGKTIPGSSDIDLHSEKSVHLKAGDEACELLMLQGRPIGEPVVQYGPFVMNTSHEIQQTMVDYHATRFGGWPFASDGPVHPRDQGRFAKHADGKIESKS